MQHKQKCHARANSETGQMTVSLIHLLFPFVSYVLLSIRSVVLATPAMCQIWAQAVAQRGDFCQSGVACCDMQTFVSIYNA